MDSRYAYAHFVKGISETDETINGELIQLNYPIYEGETNLISVAEYNRLKADFPDRIKGGIIKQDNVINMVNLLYDQLKKEIAELPELDDYTSSRLQNVSQFEHGGVLTPDHNTVSSIEDLAEKYFVLQEQVRKCQRANIDKNNYHR